MTKNICFVTNFDSIEATLNTHKYLLQTLSIKFDNIYLLDSNRFKFFKKRKKKTIGRLIKEKNIKEININTFRSLKSFFNKNNTVIINNIGKNLEDLRFLFFVSLIKIPQVQILNTDVVSYERRYEKNLFIILKFIFKKKIIPKFITFLSVIRILSKIDICFTTKKFQLNQINKKFLFDENFNYIKKSILINSLAYDIYKRQTKKIRKNNILYIDYNVNHQDTVDLRGRLSKKIENAHYKRVNIILKKLENLYKKKVIVSIHPLYSLKYTQKYLPGFKINKFNTFELIRDSEIVVFFNSTVINYAFLMNKKIINFSSNQLGENTKVESNIFPSRSGILKLDIFKEFDYSKKKLEKLFKSAVPKNKAFVKTYLKPDNNTVGLDKIVDVINKNFFN
jgi:hypothetical protein